ncbi:efflux RND transporter periplasmic adaptor subunit [Catenovulum maritimum]|uniref:Uncharacterized protein n=1 Tax=Catenovulum maritimum TaxID=1513271 RepID=A0A0J8GWH1_9ALTE|nr:efflux RND transporter periplasmic adaptor subunit [Catenovulum maritimum]KMT65644.1 hypothetical protein XM47_08080 [Catenovulum maritimum]
MNRLLIILAAMAFGCVMTIWLMPLTYQDETEGESTEKKPLYWVAPMDASYRRDKPGLSPMGMELVPVYTESENQAQSAGLVSISPEVINQLSVKTQKISLTQASKQITTLAKVEYDQNHIIHIHPRVEGWVEALFVKVTGEEIKQGQALYNLYSPQLLTAQEEFLIALKRSNQLLIQAAEDRLRALKLSDSFIQKLRESREIRQTVTFYASQSGVVNQLNIREGFYVKPGDTLMSIAKLDSVWLTAEVFEQDASFIQADLPVQFSLDYFPQQVWQGKVDYVYPELDDKTRVLRFRTELVNTDLSLKPNMFGSLTLSLPTKPVLQVPVQAVIRTGTQDRLVLAKGEGKFKSIQVQLGANYGANVEVLSGLNPGDEIVTAAHFLIDSESSKSSDFMRMETHQTEIEASSEYQSASVKGIIHQIDFNNRVLNISREAIEKWQRKAARLDFILAENIDIKQLKPEQSVYFTFEVRDDLTIVELEVLNNVQNHNLQKHKSQSHTTHSLELMGAEK